jgi:hypothetical protein
VLRYRAVVPRDSGAFKILQDAIDAIFRIYSLERSPERMDYLLSTVSSALQRSFGEIARPNDVDENGDGIMNVCFLSHARVSGSNQSRLFCIYSTSHAFLARFLPVQYILLLTLAYLKVFRVINLTLLDCKIF